jgi:hypothetical protein
MDDFSNLDADDLNIDVSSIKFDIEMIKKNVPIFSSQKLCEMIVVERYFSFKNKVSIFCMEELAKRRAEGDDFRFEEVIEEEFSKLPKLSFDLPDFGTILNQVKSQIKI